MKRVLSYIIVLIIGAAAGISGYYRIFQYGRQPQIKIIEKMKIVSVPVIRDYESMSSNEIKKQLICYDTAAPRLDVSFDNGTANLSAGLCERNWTREVRYEVGTSGNWKFFVGGAAVAVVVYGGAKLYQRVR